MNYENMLLNGGTFESGSNFVKSSDLAKLLNRKPMKTFIVAYVNYFDNDLTQTKVEAETIEEACLSILGAGGYDTSEWSEMSYHEIRTEAFNCDSVISAFELE